MRKIFTAIFIIGSIGFVVAQNAPINSNLILIKTSDKIDDSFKKIGRILLDEGYGLETADKTFYMISTKITQKKYGFMGGGSLELKLVIQFDQLQDTTIIKIKGRVNSNQLNSACGSKNSSFDKDARRIINKGANGSVIKSSWDFMDNIAKKYSPGLIEYQVEIE